MLLLHLVLHQNIKARLLQISKPFFFELKEKPMVLINLVEVGRTMWLIKITVVPITRSILICAMFLL